MNERHDQRDERSDADIVMKRIKEKVRSRRESGIPYGPTSDTHSSSVPEYDASFDIGYITGKSRMGNFSYFISSHRSLIGRLLVKGRQLVHGEVRRYVDPVFLLQSEWNATAARIIKENERRSSHIVDRIRQIERHMHLAQIALENEAEHFQVLSEEGFHAIHLLHEPFIRLVKVYAYQSAGERTPRVLEYGLHSGAISIYLSRDCNFDVFGIDNSIDLIYSSATTNKRLGGNTKFIQLDCAGLDAIKEHYFDVAFIHQMLEDLDNPSIKALVSNLLSVAKCCVFSVPSIHAPYRVDKNERRLCVDDWRTILEAAGFHVVHLEYYHENWYIVGAITR